MKTVSRFFAALCVPVLIFVSCQQESVPVAVQSVSLDKTMLDLTPDGVGVLTATVLPENAADKSVNWTSSDPSVATVTSGVVLGVAEGSAIITATTRDGGRTASCIVTVSVVHVQSVAFSSSSLTMSVGGAPLPLTCTVSPSDAANKNVSITSDNSSIAAYVGGMVYPVSSGATVIRAKSEDGGKTAACIVIVTGDSPAVPVTGVTVTPSASTVTVGGTTTLSATVSPSNATNKSVLWSSGNESVATVQNGVVTGVSAGTAVITVTTVDGGKTASSTVTVNSSGGVAVTGVKLDKTDIALEKGGAYALTATVTPDNASDKSVSWTSSNTSVATVSGGVVSAVSKGTAVITVTTTDGGKTASCKVTVSNPSVAVTGVTLSSSTLTVKKGASSTLTATVTPSDATNRNVSWKSSNTSVATVSGGKVTGVSVGTATVTVTTEDGGKTASCSVSVVEAGEYPVGVTVVQNAAENYAYAVIDFKANSNLRFNVSFVEGGAQLSNHFSNFTTRYPSKGTPIIMTNADFFFTWDGTKYSCDLVMTGGGMKRYPCFDDGNGYYPCRSTLGRNSDGTFEINWVRGGSDDGYNPNYWSLYKYSAPVKYTSVSAAESASRTWWWPEEAVGGGPRIVKGGQNTAKYYYDLECCSFSGGTSDSYYTAKTMYGFRSDGCMVILVEWYLTLAQAADRMIELGCVDAINFDGGGSSEMLGPGGKKLQAQTDASERYMPSAICISEL